MLGLSESEMFDSSPDYVAHRLNGFLMHLKWSEMEQWKRVRMLGFITSKSFGATKVKKVEDFMELGDKPKTRLTEDQIKRLKEL
jgi:hypothetical protein